MRNWCPLCVSSVLSWTLHKFVNRFKEAKKTVEYLWTPLITTFSNLYWQCCKPHVFSRIFFYITLLHCSFNMDINKVSLKMTLKMHCGDFVLSVVDEQTRGGRRIEWALGNFINIHWTCTLPIHLLQQVSTLGYDLYVVHCGLIVLKYGGCLRPWWFPVESVLELIIKYTEKCMLIHSLELPGALIPQHIWCDHH